MTIQTQTIENEKIFISTDNVLGIRTANPECVENLKKDKYFRERDATELSLPDNIIKKEDGIVKAKFNKFYFLEVAKLLKKIKSDKVTIYLKKDYPVIIETNDICTIIAPIVEEDA